VADRTKFDRQALVRVAPLSAIDKLFCDTPTPQALIGLLSEAAV
jgi:DeoR/GlpR family transcriptional regulator of sugar metabolism